jgi:hypothetical protein
MLTFCICVQVEVLNQQLSTAEHQHKAALAAVDEHKRQLADAKLALTGMHSGVVGCIVSC